MGANGTHTIDGKVYSAHGDPALPRLGGSTTRPMLEDLEDRRLMSTSLNPASSPTLLDFAGGRKAGINAPSHFPLRAATRVVNRTPLQTPVPAIAPVPPGIPAAPAIQSVITAPPTPLATAVPIISLANSPIQPGDTPRSPADFRYVLRPGAGFGGATSQPATVGTSGAKGYDAKAIARWDVVPYQTFDTTFNVGVVAFHISDIDRVEFSVNGGAWTAVRTMTKNPQTDVFEYTATLRAADFADGAIEVRAVAYPKVGIPRVLESLPLNTNGNHTLPAAVRYVSPTGSDTNDGLTPQTPKQTTNAAAFSIQQAQGSADGGTIYLLAGTYTLSSALWNTNSVTTSRWMTVAAAPGVDRSQVTIAGSVGSVFNSKLVRFHNLTITGDISSGGPVTDYLWIDGNTIKGPGRTVGAVGGIGWTGRYITDTSITDVTDGASGYELVRNVSVERLGGDAFSNSLIVVNSSVADHDPAEMHGIYHPDVYQSVGVASNVILYGVTATESMGRVQGLQFNQPPVGVAIVNCHIASGGFYVMQLGGMFTNIYFRDTDLIGGTTYLDGFHPVDVVFQNVTFTSPLPPLDGVEFR